MSENLNLKTMNAREILQRITTPKDNQQLEEYYDRIAQSYEQISIKDFGRSQEEDRPFLETIIKYVPKEGRILDAGVGTGTIGQYLDRLGYRNLVGIDLSLGMLAEARKKEVYTDLKKMILGETLDFADRTFDAVICSRTLAIGHAPSSSFDELIRITKPGGYIIFTIKTDFYESSDFKDKVPALIASGRWELVEISDPYKPLPKVEPNLYYQVRVCRIL
ncbi:MAG: methyltransferase domain-containing protein [Microcoleaceae cyanobacterium]